MKKQIILIILGMFLISGICAVGEVSYCCEKTKLRTDGSGGAWCQNAPEDQCETGICGVDSTGNQVACKKAPTSCEATSYCKLGTCISEGECMENTPERRCDKELGGYWEGKDANTIPQCGLGCCLIGEQAAFVTQTRCKVLSALYGLETNFRTDLSSEVSCIAVAMSGVKGACVYEKDYAKTCQFLTKKECAELSVENVTEFHEGFLCSAETLATNCGKSKKTTCVEGRDEVYFLDTCGNLANIYDSSKINNQEYWTNVYGKDRSCGPSSSNANSASCGNCDYFLGSTCKDYKIAGKRATHGDNICKDLSCKYDRKNYKHGETWCANSNGISTNLPGSRYFRLVCYNGEVSVEPCADFRQEVCLQSDIDGFKTAACRANMWQDCTAQTTSKNCNNIDRRDCEWHGEDSIKCVPRYDPGFNFWELGDATTLCAKASATCNATFEKRLGADKWDCEENCHCCVDDEEHKGCTGANWPDTQNSICTGLGDCGSKQNYLGVQGF